MFIYHVLVYSKCQYTIPIVGPQLLACQSLGSLLSERKRGSPAYRQSWLSGRLHPRNRFRLRCISFLWCDLQVLILVVVECFWQALTWEGTEWKVEKILGTRKLRSSEATRCMSIRRVSAEPMWKRAFPLSAVILVSAIRLICIILEESVVRVVFYVFIPRLLNSNFERPPTCVSFIKPQHHWLPGLNQPLCH